MTSPNVVMVVLDDVGYADLGCYGSEISTPAVDAWPATASATTNFLHHRGRVLPPGPACSPDATTTPSACRRSQTGTPAFPGSRGRVARTAGTLGEMLRPHGYGTFAVGKWHLTSMDETSHAGPYDDWPIYRGFERFYGFFDGANNWDPSDLLYDNHRVLPPTRPDYHLSEDLVDRSIELSPRPGVRDPEKPFFLYLCFFACHGPYHAPKQYLQRCRGRYDQGWDVARAARLKRQKQLGIVPTTTELPPRNFGVEAWETLSSPLKRLTARIYESYAAMLEHTDAQIGRLVSFLDRIGKRDNTLIIVVSDNGATREGGTQGIVNWHRATNVMPYRPIETELDDLDEVGGPFSGPINAIGWSMVGNTPLKRYKGETHGGGIRDPLIVSWPACISDHGGLRHQFCHAIDVAPTILDLIGCDPPSDINGIPQQPVEGESVAHTLDDATAPTPKTAQYFEMLGHRGIWHDGWKAVTNHAAGTDFDADQWELYNLDVDLGECHDQSTTVPREAARHDRALVGTGRRVQRATPRRPRP